MSISLARLYSLLLVMATGLFAQAEAPMSHAEQIAGGKYELGALLLVVGMGSVFTGLIAVYIFLRVLERVSRSKNPIGIQEVGGVAVSDQVEVSTEMATAIALALYMDLRTFDEGTAEEVTIRKITRPFSPWWNAAKTQIIFDKVEMFRRKY
jgi:Na+-transporting methylmalonyl-CoA/oxaloacetate decarboxylase gamma subunit